MLQSLCSPPSTADHFALQRARDELAKEVLFLQTRVTELEDFLDKIQDQSKDGQAPSTPLASPSPSGKYKPGDVKSLQRDVEMLLQELDHERAANLELVSVVEASRLEAAKAAERLVAAEKQIRALKRSGGKFSSAESSSDLAAPPEQLHERIFSLKGARDRLIEALDVQAAEAERLALENSALGEALVEARSLAASWEAQAQQGLAQCSQLKDLLEESATWGASGLPAEDAVAVPDAEGGADQLAARCRRLEQEALQQAVRRSELEAQVHALCAELTRLAAVSTQTQRAVVPVLCGVEARLAALLHTKAGKRPR